MRCAAGHQVNLYPYSGFFGKASFADHFVLVDTTQYVKKQWQNRNRIKLSNGNVHWLSIPVKTRGRFDQRINEVEIKDGTNWRRDHRRTLELNYKKSPFFDAFYPRFEALLTRPWEKLSEYNIAVIRTCFDLLGIDTEISLASELGVEGRNNDLILDICRKTGCDAYLHGMHARDYVDFSYLQSHGVKSLIQDYQVQEYEQPWGVFAGNLAVLDVIFNCGAASLDVICKGNRITAAEPISST